MQSKLDGARTAWFRDKDRPVDLDEWPPFPSIRYTTRLLRRKAAKTPKLKRDCFLVEIQPSKARGYAESDDVSITGPAPSRWKP